MQSYGHVTKKEYRSRDLEACDCRTTTSTGTDTIHRHHRTEQKHPPLLSLCNAIAALRRFWNYPNPGLCSSATKRDSNRVSIGDVSDEILENGG